MSKEDDQDAEWVSLLADGELSAQDLARTMARLGNSADAHRTWDSYQLIGEVMRSGGANARAHDPHFVQKLRRKLDQEAIKVEAVDAVPIRATGQNSINVVSANDGWWRRVAGLASVALVGVLAWQGYVLMDRHGAGASPQMAQAGGSAAVVASSVANANGELQAVMLRDPQLDALLAAHRQFGGTSALQMPSGFLRNATFIEGQR